MCGSCGATRFDHRSSCSQPKVESQAAVAQNMVDTQCWLVCVWISQPPRLCGQKWEAEKSW